MGLLLRRHYKKADPVKSEPAKVDYTKTTKKELVEIAKIKGIDGSKMTKEELVQVLNGH